MTPSQKLRSIADSTGLDGIADAIREIANEIEHNNAPAVPQGLERYEPTVMVEESRGRLTATGAVMKPKEDGRWVRLRDLTATPAPAPAPAQGEPFGYFRAEPFGWTDCSEDAEGAIALYEHPAKPAQEPVAWMWQHDETGRTGFVEATQLQMGWQEANPRLQVVAPLYTAPASEPEQEMGLTDDQDDAVSMALRRAWQLGQTYWQQADSDYISQHKESEDTQREFEKLCDDTIAALRAKGAV